MEDVERRFGVPARRTTVDGCTIWVYYISCGGLEDTLERPSYAGEYAASNRVYDALNGYGYHNSGFFASPYYRYARIVEFDADGLVRSWR